MRDHATELAGPIKARPALNDLFVRDTPVLDAGEVETIVGCFLRADR